MRSSKGIELERDDGRVMRREGKRIRSIRRCRRRACLAVLVSVLVGLLAGCAADRLMDLEVVYDLTQQDQRDAEGNTLLILGPEGAEQETPEEVPEAPQAELAPPETETEEAAVPAAQQEQAPALLEEESVEALQEQMELAPNKKTREEIDREDEENRRAIGLTEAGIHALMEENAGNYYFDHLDPEGQRLYAELLQITTARGEKVKVSSLKEEEVDRAFQYVMADHPELFYADGYTYTRYTIDGEMVKLGFTARYTCDKTQEERRRSEIESMVGEIVSGAPATGDQYELAKYVYDYIIDHTEYEIGSPDNQNICSVFLNGRSVCQGYAKATQLLLDRLGVDTTLVTGTVATEGREPSRHAWNLARVNGNDYYLDTTWGDSSFQQIASQDGAARRINYDYLLDTTEDLTGTHTIDGTVEMPLCTHLEDNYYVRDGARFTEVNKEQLADLFDRAYAERRGSVTVKCADEAAYQAMTQYLITDRGLFDYLREAGNSASFASSDTQRTLSFVL